MPFDSGVVCGPSVESGAGGVLVSCSGPSPDGSTVGGVGGATAAASMEPGGSGGASISTNWFNTLGKQKGTVNNGGVMNA